MGTAVTPVHVHVPSATAIMLYHHVPQQHWYVALHRVNPGQVYLSQCGSHMLGRGEAREERQREEKGYGEVGLRSSHRDRKEKGLD